MFLVDTIVYVFLENSDIYNVCLEFWSKLEYLFFWIYYLVREVELNRYNYLSFRKIIWNYRLGIVYIY